MGLVDRPQKLDLPLAAPDQRPHRQPQMVGQLRPIVRPSHQKGAWDGFGGDGRCQKYTSTCILPFAKHGQHGTLGHRWLAGGNCGIVGSSVILRTCRERADYAHNPGAAGSNPAPATLQAGGGLSSRRRGPPYRGFTAGSDGRPVRRDASPNHSHSAWRVSWRPWTLYRPAGWPAR